MAKNKTTENNNSVAEYVAAITDDKKRNDCAELIALISKQTGLPSKMWGAGIVGWGSYHYKYASGHEGDAPVTALAARANAIVLYLSSAFAGREELQKKLGKHKAGKGCIYIQKLADIDLEILSEMITASVSYIQEKHSL